MTRDPIVEQALSILSCQVREANALANPDAARDFVRLKLGDRPHEVLAVLFLDVQNRVIEFKELFRGTLTQTSVYPREDRGAGLSGSGSDPGSQPSIGHHNTIKS